MGLFDSVSVLVLFLGFHDVLIVLFRLEREWSAYFYRLAVRREEKRENSAFGVCMVLHGDIMVQG